MQTSPAIHLADVQAVYSGPEGRLWELVMGEQIHIGGLSSSFDLARRAGIAAGQSGVDLCCCTGAGMRFLLRFMKVAHMTGVDATPAVIALGRRRAEEGGVGSRSTFVEAEAGATGLTSCCFDFVWGEDAWCYVEDKPALIAEAARLLKPGGTMAFTDWMEGPVSMTPDEARRYLDFMKFPSILSLDEYNALLRQNGFEIRTSFDTGRFAKYVPLYIDMIEKQLTYDVLKIIGFDQAAIQAISGEMRFMQSLADAGKIIQGLVVAVKGG